jgi:hypothetical protein
MAKQPFHAIVRFDSGYAECSVASIQGAKDKN